MSHIVCYCANCSGRIAPRKRVCDVCGDARYESKDQCTEQVMRQAFDLRMHGFQFVEIVVMLGLTIAPAGLRRRLWEAGKRFPRSGPHRPFSAAQVHLWAQRRAEGKTWKEIAYKEPYSAERIAHAVRTEVKK